MKQTTKKWGHTLVSTTINSIATAGLAYVGFGASDMLLDTKIMQALDWRAFAITVGIGGLIGAFRHLQKSPLPPLEGDGE